MSFLIPHDHPGFLMVKTKEVTINVFIEFPPYKCSVFAYSCPLQNDKFLYVLADSHHVQLDKRFGFPKTLLCIGYEA